MIDYSGIPNSGLLGRALRMPLRLVPKSAQVPILQGPLKGKRWISGSFNHGCWLGSYEASKQKELIRLIRPGMVCWDIGANVGFYTLLLAELVGNTGKVFAFEPLPRNLELLRRHVQMNKYHNVRILPCALGDFDGETAFDEGTEPSSAHSASEGALKVSSRRADSLLAAAEIELPDVIKIDVEGAEACVLRGAQRVLDHKAMVLLATHGDLARRECHDLLAASGYSIRALDGEALSDADEFLAVSVNK